MHVIETSLVGLQPQLPNDRFYLFVEVVELLPNIICIGLIRVGQLHSFHRRSCGVKRVCVCSLRHADLQVVHGEGNRVKAVYVSFPRQIVLKSRRKSVHVVDVLPVRFLRDSELKVVQPRPMLMESSQFCLVTHSFLQALQRHSDLMGTLLVRLFRNTLCEPLELDLHPFNAHLISFQKQLVL